MKSGIRFEYNIYMGLQGVEVNGHHNYLERIYKRKFSMEETLVDWYKSGKAEEFRKVYLSHHDRLLKEYCGKICGGIENCLGFGHCNIDMDQLHGTLYDKVLEVEK